MCKEEASTTGEKGKGKKKKKVEKPVRRLKDEDSSTYTSEAQPLGRIVESVAAAFETAISETQSQSGMSKCWFPCNPGRAESRQEYGDS